MFKVRSIFARSKSSVGPPVQNMSSGDSLWQIPYSLLRNPCGVSDWLLFSRENSKPNNQSTNLRESRIFVRYKGQHFTGMLCAPSRTMLSTHLSHDLIISEYASGELLEVLLQKRTKLAGESICGGLTNNNDQLSAQCIPVNPLLCMLRSFLSKLRVALNVDVPNTIFRAKREKIKVT